MYISGGKCAQQQHRLDFPPRYHSCMQTLMKEKGLEPTHLNLLRI